MDELDYPADALTGEVLDDLYFENLRKMRAAAAAASIVRGKPIWEWAPVLEQMKRSQDYAEALALYLECIDAMERYSAIMQRPGGAAGWYERAAVVFRKVGDYEGEVAVIDRGLAFMPASEVLSKRRTRTLQLQARERQT